MTMKRFRTMAAAVAIAAFAALPGLAQPIALPPPYGAPITLEIAKKAMAAAEAEAARNNWPVVIVILDSGGNMVMLHRIEDAQLASIQIAEGKARTALILKRPSKAFEEAIAAGGGGLRLTTLAGVTAVEGGHPIVVGGKIVGAIGVSGVLSAQDSQVARAGLDALK